MSRTRPAVLELFCGIGGCAAALGARGNVVAAVDQSRVALDVYSHNFAHPVLPVAVETIPANRWHAWAEATWWMSPPCTPYTHRGRRRDVDDPRARSLLSVVERIAAVRPSYVALENVPGFEGSRAHALLRDTLAAAGYTVRETRLCPTALGLPNRRDRFYLVAGLGPLNEWPVPSGASSTLATLLDAVPDPALACDPALARQYAGALNVVDARDPEACAACFTAAYGRSPVRSGSYLLTGAALRRFSPAEVLRLLGFPDNYRLPPGLPLHAAWRLVGNSVSVRAVQWVLAAIPGLEPGS